MRITWAPQSARWRTQVGHGAGAAASVRSSTTMRDSGSWVCDRPAVLVSGMA